MRSPQLRTRCRIRSENCCYSVFYYYYGSFCGYGYAPLSDAWTQLHVAVEAAFRIQYARGDFPHSNRTIKENNSQQAWHFLAVNTNPTCRCHSFPFFSFCLSRLCWCLHSFALSLQRCHYSFSLFFPQLNPVWCHARLCRCLACVDGPDPYKVLKLKSSFINSASGSRRCVCVLAASFWDGQWQQFGRFAWF